MPTRITVRFYRVDRRAAEQPRFIACLERILALPDGDRPRDISGAVIQVQQIGQERNLLWGDLVRLQADNLPSLVERGGAAAILELPDGKSLGHHTAFLYDSETRMLGYQMTRSSVSMTRFNLYVSEIGGCETFAFVPVLKPSELRQLNQITPRTFYIKVADPADLEAIENPDMELRDNLMALQDLAHGAYVKVTIGLGRRRGELDRGRIRGAISWLLEQRARNRGKVRALQVDGEAADGEPVPKLDFLKAHVGDSEAIDLPLAPSEHFKARLNYLRGRRTANDGVLRQFARDDP